MVKEEDYNRYTRGIGGIALKISMKMRRALYQKFLNISEIKEAETVLDAGVTADADNPESNFFEMLYPIKHKITAVGISDASFLEKKFPGLRFICANAKKLPFDDSVFDFVFSNAVIEHVGSDAEQLVFLSELCRVAKKGIFIATPNRWFPVETHHFLFFAHWLPKKWFYKILFLLKRFDYCDEDALNLLSYNKLYKMCKSAGFREFKIYKNRFFGLTSNLMLYIDKAAIKQLYLMEKRLND